jgi:hypothetical protein
MGYKQSKQNNKSKQNTPPHGNAYEVASSFVFNRATIGYFATQKVMMLEKMEEATTDGERIGYAENINLLGNFKQQAEELDALYVLNLKQKYPRTYKEIVCDVVLPENSVECFCNHAVYNGVIDPAFNFDGATSIHYNRVYRVVHERAQTTFMDLIDKNIISTMGASRRQISDEEMSQYNIMENLFR